MKSKSEPTKFSHSAALRANKLATDSSHLKAQAEQQRKQLEEHQDRIPDETTGKIITNYVLTFFAIMLLVCNIMLDVTAIQNILNLQGDKIILAYGITAGLAISAMVFGAMVEEGFEPRLSAPMVNNSTTAEWERIYLPRPGYSINSKKWIRCGMGILLSLTMVVVLYKINQARFAMKVDLGSINNQIGSSATFLPILLYIAEMIASFSLIGSFEHFQNGKKSRHLGKLALQTAKEAKSVGSKAIDLWYAYLMDLQEYNEQNEKAIPAHRPNEHLIRLLNDQNAEQLNTSESSIKDVDIEENVNERNPDVENGGDEEDNDYGFEPITNKPI